MNKTTSAAKLSDNIDSVPTIKKIVSDKNVLARIIHHNMAIVGGFFAGYAILTRCDILGSAQTANLIHLAVSVLDKNPKALILHFTAFVLYIAAACMFVVIKNKTRHNIKKISIMTDAAAAVVLGFLSSDLEPMIALYPIFFAMSFQWNAFPGIYDYASATIFSTNNVRQIALSITEYFCGMGKEKLHKAVFFLGTLVCFHIGVSLAYFSSNTFGIKCIWLLPILLVPAFAAVCHEEKLQKINN